MCGVLSGVSGYMAEHKSKIFWFFFIVLGIFVIGGEIFNLFFIDILLGLVMIVIGVQRLEEEHHKRTLESEQKKINETIKYMAQWLDASHDYISEVKNRHESRLFNLDKKKADLDSKVEMNYRDMVRKIIDIENRLNEISMTYARGQDVRSGRGKR